MCSDALDPRCRFAKQQNRRAELGTIGFLDASLNEWSRDDKNFISGLLSASVLQGPIQDYLPRVVGQGFIA